MFVSIHHQIHDGQRWKQKVDAMAPPPAGLRPGVVCTASTGSSSPTPRSCHASQGANTNLPTVMLAERIARDPTGQDEPAGTARSTA